MFAFNVDKLTAADKRRNDGAIGVNFNTAAENLFGFGIHRPFTVRFFADKFSGLRNDVKGNLFIENFLIINQRIVHIDFTNLRKQFVHGFFAVNGS